MSNYVSSPEKKVIMHVIIAGKLLLIKQTDSFASQTDQGFVRTGKKSEKTKWQIMSGKGGEERDWGYTRFAVTLWDARNDKTISPRQATIIDPIRSTHQPNPCLPIFSWWSATLSFSDWNMMNRSRGQTNSWPSVSKAREHIGQNQIR